MVVRKAKSKLGRGEFTLRQIEEQRPCWTGYKKFLDAMKTNPVPEGPYTSSESEISHGIVMTKFKKPKYGPDDPISITILPEYDERTSHTEWLLCNVEQLGPLMDTLNELKHDEQFLLGLVIGGEYPPKKSGRKSGRKKSG